jgi:hypothetical protein
VEGGKMWMRRCGMRRCAGADVGENVEDERGMRRVLCIKVPELSTVSVW